MTTIQHFADNGGMLRHKCAEQAEKRQLLRPTLSATCWLAAQTTGERPPSTLVAVPVI